MHMELADFRSNISQACSSESIATLPPFGPIEGQKWFVQISSQWESQKNRFAFMSFGKIQFLPPCIWNVPFISYRLGWMTTMNQLEPVFTVHILHWARIFILLRSQRIDTKKQIPPGCGVWSLASDGPVRQPYSYSVPAAAIDCLKIPALWETYRCSKSPCLDRRKPSSSPGT